MPTYVIGDVQGCYDHLERLLKKMNFNASQDQLWFAGDLVNRGPKSLEVLRFVNALGSNAISVLGNHDLHLLALAYVDAKPNASDTLEAILSAPDRDDLLAWLAAQPLMHVDEQHKVVLTHAGIPPIWNLQQATDYANEVQRVMQSEQRVGYLEHLYGDQPDCWYEQLTAWDRLRLITNYFTRMRLCDTKGRLELKSKGKPEPKASNLRPWFEYPSLVAPEYTLLFGHWAALEGVTGRDDILALDTGAVWGGQLTALRLDDRRYFRV